MAKNNPKLKRILLDVFMFAAIFLIIFLVLHRILPGFTDILEHGSEEEIQEYIRSFGSFRGLLLAYLLQTMQIISIVFPGGPIQIAIGIVFGTWEGLLVCHAGYMTANVLVFLLSRRLGHRIDSLFPEDEKQGKIATYIKNSKDPAFMVFLACLMPFVPNGVVPHIASKTKITFSSFFWATFFGCIPTLMVLNAIGSKLLKGDYFMAVLFIVMLGAFILLMWLKCATIISTFENLRHKVLVKLHLEH